MGSAATRKTREAADSRGRDNTMRKHKSRRRSAEGSRQVQEENRRLRVVLLSLLPFPHGKARQLTCKSSRTRRQPSGSTSWSSWQTPRCRCCDDVGWDGMGWDGMGCCCRQLRSASMTSRACVKGGRVAKGVCKGRRLRVAGGKARTCFHIGASPP